MQTYCSVLLDNNNRKPICRLYMNGSRKAIGLFDNGERKEERIAIAGPDDIHSVAERLRAAVKLYNKVGESSQ